MDLKNISPTVVVEIGLILTLIINETFKWLREKRQRAWELEDKARAAAERAQLKELVQENTAISVQAFKEANRVNEKLALVVAQSGDKFDKVLQSWQAEREAAKELLVEKEGRGERAPEQGAGGHAAG